MFRLTMVLPMFALLAACATAPSVQDAVAGGAYTQVQHERSAATPVGGEQTVVRDAKGAVVVHKVPFELGVSTVTVERMARRSGCMSEKGAGLLTEAGPLEVYRVQCLDGGHFMAKCELRQCRPMGAGGRH